MNKDNFKTVVIFRKFKDGDVIALFPYMISSGSDISSYMHIGQHGSAGRFLTLSTKPASQNEYNDLKSELENLGYNLEIKKRINHNKYLVSYYDSIKPNL